MILKFFKLYIKRLLIKISAYKSFGFIFNISFFCIYNNNTTHSFNFLVRAQSLQHNKLINYNLLIN